MIAKNGLIKKNKKEGFLYENNNKNIIKNEENK
jgi:hypothetical protein